MKKTRLQSLMHQYLNNTIQPQDCIELLAYLDTTDPGEVSGIIDEELFSLDSGPEFRGVQSLAVLNRIKSDPRFTHVAPIRAAQPKVVKLYQKTWIRIAAAILVFFTAGLFVFNHKKSIPDTSRKFSADVHPAVIVPGGNKALLVMGNGKTILLDSAANGVLAKTAGSSVVKTRNGQIIYNATGQQVAATSVSYNTLSTPKGGTYQVVLPDGTRVWLNAASSIVYPTAFAGNERNVKLSGEAYFEVAKNKDKPFYVNIDDVKVRVLGTHFNIQAYSDDAQITTTLLEGAVQVTKNKASSLLKPGQQAVIGNGSDKITVSEANINDAMAWKNGYFIFNDDNITGIMKKVSRWYDVDVEYRGNYNNQEFGGTYYRSKGINELLQHLEKIGKIRFAITGRRITVME